MEICSYLYMALCLAHTCAMFDKAHSASSQGKSLTILHNGYLVSVQHNFCSAVCLIVAAERTLDPCVAEVSTPGTRAQS